LNQDKKVSLKYFLMILAKQQQIINMIALN